MLFERPYPERSVRVAFITLIVIQLVLVACHVGAIIWDTTAPSDVTKIVRGFFELSKEGNAPTWFSSFLFTLIGLACGVIYLAEGNPSSGSRLKCDATDKTRPGWLLFAALFLFLSFDETSQLHERLDWMMSGFPEGGQAALASAEPDGDSLPFYRYLLIYVPVLGVSGLAMAWFVAHRFRHRMTALLFVLGMAVLAMKLVIESFEKWSLSMFWFDHSIYLEAVIIEMSCLFTGATIIFTSLLRHLCKLIEGSTSLRSPTMGTTFHSAGEDPAKLDAKASM
ncbi:MAG: hypothetical protein OEU92_03220 [Alphaproteobacteria bacterium]|nr:hypothetical protein [Alphaproteobacteria bacterium]